MYSQIKKLRRSMMTSKRRNMNRLPPFVALTWNVLNSRAYKDLKQSAAKALPYFLGKYKGVYNDPLRYEFEFQLSYSEGGRYGFASGTFSSIIQELIKKGFIDPVDKGGLRSDGKSCNLFKLSRRWEKYGQENFERIEWKRFCPKPRSKATAKSEIDSHKK